MGVKMQKSEKKQLWIGILIGSIICIATLGALLVIVMLWFFLGEPLQVITGVDRYEEAFELGADCRTGFIVFPEQIPKGAQETDFYFGYDSGFDEPAVEAFLQCTYTEEAYLAEMERLENTQKQYGSRTSTLHRDEKGDYSYPAYIAMEGFYYGDEYALLTGERQITYICMDCMYPETLKKVEEKYLPTSFIEGTAPLNHPKGYSIYLKKMDVRENGDIVGWETDYSRDELVEVLEHNYVKVGYNLFYVNVVLDEKDRKIIKNCDYTYYTSRHDTMYGLPDKIVYDELAGYEYKSLELSADEKQAIVTYYDNGEEKTFVYDIPEEIAK